MQIRIMLSQGFVIRHSGNCRLISSKAYVTKCTCGYRWQITGRKALDIQHYFIPFQDNLMAVG